MFVVLEGGDASGKSTQAALLAARLRAGGVDVVETFEPGATALGADLRRALLHGDSAVGPVAETLLMAADRAQHLAEVVAPALARGATVVSDRFLPSSLAYQGVAREVGVEVVDEVNRTAVATVPAPLVIVVDVSEATAEQRRGEASDRLEAAGRAFHAAVRAAYRQLAGERGWVIVDGEGSVDEVADRVWATVEGRNSE